MKRKTLILFSIAAIFWIIGSLLIYKKGETNASIISTGIIILIGFITQIKKEKTT